jgi:WD40 repeat protein
MDQGIYIWTILSKRKKEHMPLAHMYGPVVSVAWKDENTLISAGSDTVIKTWDNVKLPVA